MIWRVPTDHSIHSYDTKRSREQLTQEPAPFQSKPAGEQRRLSKLLTERTGLKDGKPTESERCIRFNSRARRIVLLLIFPTIAALIQPSRAAGDKSLPNGQISVSSKYVLVLCSYGYALPAYQKINPAFLAVMARAGVSTNSLFFEYLDLLHIRDTEHRKILADMLRHKYAARGIDLIVTLHAPAMTFLLNEAKDVFPQAPVVSWNVPEAFNAEDGARAITRLSISLDLQGTLARALDLFPRTERVVFIIGVSEIDKYVETEARSVFANWKSSLQFEYTSNLSVEKLLARVADLPPRSICIYGNIFQDNTGRTFIPRDVGRRVAGTANAPVFCLYDTLMGFGVGGGSLLSFEAEGGRAGRLALDILSGNTSDTGQKAVMAGKPVAMFDWQVIKKWGGRLNKLPADGIFINRPASLWNRYAGYIAGFVVLMLGQFLLIASLLLQKRRRRGAEKALKEINETLEQRVADRTAELNEGEARYRTLFNSMTEGFALHEIITAANGKPCDYRFLEINPAFERLTGLSRAATLGKTVREILPDIEDFWIETYGRVTIEGASVHFDNYSAPLDRWYEVFAYRTASRQFAVAFKDITDRKRAEEALAASERKYRELLETANSIIIRWDNQGIIRYINDYGLRFFGYSSEQLNGRNVMTIVPKVEENTGRDLEALVKDILIHPEQHTYVPNQNIRRDGKTVWVAWTNKAILDHRGNVQEILAIGNDISALKETEAALRESEREKRLILENANEIIAYYDTDNRLIWANKAYLDAVDLPLSRLKGKLCYICWGLERLCTNCPVTESIQTGKPQSAELTPENQPQWPADQGAWLIRAAPVKDSTGNIIGVIEVAHDITESKRAEKALRDSEERIRVSLGEKEVLLKEIHHRVKNNMQVISSLIALQAEELQADAMRAILLNVTHRVRSMAMVHEKLYQSADLARIELSEYIRSLLDYLWRAHGKAASGVRLALDLQQVSISVNTAVPCGLILNELVSNALKHAFRGRPGGEVGVSLRGGKKDRVHLSVRDNGIGLPAGFDWRQASSLGLRLVQMLARQLHAAVEMSADGGTVFAITFGEPEI